MPQPDPYRGVYRWAWHRTQRFLKSLTGGVVFVSVAGAVAAAVLVAPPHAGVAIRVAYGLGAAAAGLVGLLALTYAAVLAVAPFQQRNALRAELETLRVRTAEEVKTLQARSAQEATALTARAEKEIGVLQARVAELETAPVNPQHLQQLHLIAGQLREAVQAGRTPLYGMPAGIDENIWRTVFLEHFPDLRPHLATAERKGLAVKAFAERLEYEAHQDGMDLPPWTAQDFLPVIVTMTESRALSGNLDVLFRSNWRMGGGQLVLIPSELEIARGLPQDINADVLVRQFIDWATDTQRWPEAAAIRQERDLLHEAAEDTAAKLKLIENLCSVTSRCYLCRQHDGRVVGPIVPPDEHGSSAAPEVS